MRSQFFFGHYYYTCIPQKCQQKKQEFTYKLKQLDPAEKLIF
jgi:hypothetical protein